MSRKADYQHDVFISYSRKDKQKVQRLVSHLQDAGLEVWFDRDKIDTGSSFSGDISKGIQESRKMVVCFSPDALKSKWVEYELNAAITRDPTNKERRLIPLIIEKCKLPDSLAQFDHLQWIDEEAKVVEKLIERCKAPQIEKKPIKQLGQMKSRPPGGVMRIGDPHYIERDEDAFITGLPAEQFTSITIKAPAEMGKSNLLVRYVEACKQQGMRTVQVTFYDIQGSDLKDYTKFLTRLVRLLWQELERPSQATPLDQCDHYAFDECIENLMNAFPGEKVVVALDNVERIIGEDYQDDFFRKLRNWHDQRANIPIWARLGLALAVSTERYLQLDKVNHLPSDVGETLELSNFSRPQCKMLEASYRVHLRNTEFNILMELLDGHPKLMHLAYRAIATTRRSRVRELLGSAADEDGPFSHHLQELRHKLRDYELLDAMKQISCDGTLPDNNKDIYYKLKGAGLVRLNGKRYVAANQLYAQYFRDPR